MTKSQAGKIVKKMLGSYPSVNLHDPQTYAAAICELLVRYPIWAGENAVNRALTSDESKFIPPTLGILRPLLEAEVRVHRYAAEWNAGAEKLLALAPPPGENERQLAERKAHIARLREQYGPTFGINSGRPRPPTQAESQEALIAQIGQEAFDAIPDAGIRSDDWQKLRAPKLDRTG
jgi:hypothetical protein